METSGTSYKWKALATVALSTMMGAMDFTFVNLSLPMLTKIFKTDLATVVWLNLTFSVVLITLGPFLGKINDVIGRKRVFVTGSAFIAFGLVTCSLSQTIGQLILFRVVYAIGNAMTSTCHAAIITDAFPPERTGQGTWTAELIPFSRFHHRICRGRNPPQLAGLEVDLLREGAGRAYPVPYGAHFVEKGQAKGHEYQVRHRRDSDVYSRSAEPHPWPEPHRQTGPAIAHYLHPDNRRPSLPRPLHLC